MNSPVIIIISIAAATFAVYWFVFRKKPKQLTTTAPGIVLPKELIGYTRADGAKFYTTKPVGPDQRLILSAVIMDALREMIDASQYWNPTWTKGMNSGDYEVCFIPPMATTEEGYPALVVAGVRTAGTVINVGANQPADSIPMIVMPEQANWEYLDYLKTSVHNEGEHAREFLNDRNIFLRFTGANDVHPHWGTPPVEEIIGADV